MAFVACQESEETTVTTTVETGVLSWTAWADTIGYIAIAAHRGYHVIAPENSVAAINAAVALGIEMVELDVRTTKDGILILMHDATLSRTTSGSGTVAETNYAQLEDLLLLTDDGETTTYTIPTLEQALKAAKGKIFVDLDVKVADYQSVLDVIQKTGTNEQVMVLADDVSTFDDLEVTDGFFLNAVCHSQTELETFLLDSQIPMLNLTQNVVTADNTQAITAAGKLSFRGMTGDMDEELVAGEYSTLNGVLTVHPDILHTDYPATLLPYLEEQQYR